MAAPPFDFITDLVGFNLNTPFSSLAFTGPRPLPSCPVWPPGVSSGLAHDQWVWPQSLEHDNDDCVVHCDCCVTQWLCVLLCWYGVAYSVYFVCLTTQACRRIGLCHIIVCSLVRVRPRHLRRPLVWLQLFLLNR